MDNRPQGREKKISGKGKGIKRRGSGLGTGKVGSGTAVPPFPRDDEKEGTPSRGPKGGRSGGGLTKIVLLIAALLFGGKLGTGFLGGSGTPEPAQPADEDRPAYYYTQDQGQSAPYGYGSYADILEQLLGVGYSGTQQGSNMTQGFSYSDFFGAAGLGSSPASSGSGWMGGDNTGVLNTQIVPDAHAKRTAILGGGKDSVTIMLYMCGTDLESKNAMGTKDLQEMLNADVGGKVNLLIYTGGCSGWRNNVVSSAVNQIYKVEDGSLLCVEKNMGTGSMVDPDTLSDFIRYCAQRYPANRKMLILWDHGGGSVTGFGYDEKIRGSGAMDLRDLDKALADGGTDFEFIGFDACLMGTVETALTMAPYADYLLASEETEPGVGWYYTSWLNALSKNTSLPATELGKLICDGFVDDCRRKCPGQATTLSLTDLGELSATVPESFTAFAQSTGEMLDNDGYAQVSNARSSSREFAADQRLDQVDLVHMSLLLDTPESRELAEAILSAVKYNRTSSSMTNAYGLSVYFPYRRTSQLNAAVENYDAVGISPAYARCIEQFCIMQSAGQGMAGTTSPLGPLNGSGSTAYGGIDTTDMLTILLGQLLGGCSMDTERAAAYLLDNRFDPDALFWEDRGSGSALYLSEEQWALVQELELNVFVDVGDGYADLGLDNTFSFNEDGSLRGSFDNSWIAINGQELAYYHTDSTVENGSYTITGRVPVLLNGERADLILIFSSERPEGYIAGVRYDYKDGETDTVAKLAELYEGDVIDFLCDFYTYDGEFEDAFMIGDPLIYSGDEEISNVYLSDDALAVYCITDIYNKRFWTPVIP